MTRRDDTGQQVRGTGPRVPEHDGDLACGFVEAFRHMCARGFVSHRNVLNSIFFEGREKWIDLGTGQSEYEAYAFLCETAGQCLTSSDLRHGLLLLVPEVKLRLYPEVGLWRSVEKH